ncbi:MAG: cytochrome b [Actinomycetota bacterium]
MIDRLYAALDDRLGVARLLRGQLSKPFPSHWSFLLGEVALYSFIVLILTGVFLTFFFEPSTEEIVYSGAYQPLRGVEMSRAYASVLETSFSVRAGLVMRQIHHWAALVFVAAIVVHLARVFFTGAFRKPRELNWVVGTTMLILAIGNGFLGYSLVDDLLSGTGLRIGYSIVLSVPVVGEWMAFLLFGGEFPTPETIPRFYAMHIFLLPALLGILIAVHLAIVWHQKHTQFPAPGRTESNVVGTRFWPGYTAKSVGLFFLVTAALALLGGLVQINPVWLYGPFDPAAVSSPAQPDWYLGWVEGAMRLAPPWDLQLGDYLIPETFLPTVALPGLTFLGIYLWPFLEARFTGDHSEHHLLDRPGQRPVRTAVGVAATVFYGILLLAGSDDVLAVSTEAEVVELVWVLRAAALLLPPVAGWATYRILR